MIDKLMGIGMNQNEAKAYLFLVNEGVSTAYQVSKGSSVPNGKVYQVLDSLVEKGFVKKFDGKPQRFVSLDPQVAINAIVDDREKELGDFKDKIGNVISSIGELSKKNESDVLDTLKIIEGYKNYLNLSVSLHKKVEREWITISELSTYKPHIDAYKKNVKDKIKIRILTSKKEATDDKLKVWKKIGAEIRFMEYLPTKFTVIDGSDVTLRIADKDKYISLWIQNKVLALGMKEHFDMLWKKAEKFK